MSSWQTDLTKGIEDYVRTFEDAEMHVQEVNVMRRTHIRKEYDEALQKLRGAREAVSAFVGVYVVESRK